MKITLPEVWGCEHQAADESIYKRSFMFVKQWNRHDDLVKKIDAILSFFTSYENMYSLSFAKYAMKVNVAYNVLHFACAVGESRGITEDVILGLWKQVFGRDIWEFTGRYSPCSKRQAKLQKI